MKVVVIGLGYVGVPLAASLATVSGQLVNVFQRNSETSGWKVDALNSGKSPIGGVEPGLEELIKKMVDEGKLKATDDSKVLADADAVLITVQTPVDPLMRPCLSNLAQALEETGRRLKTGALVSVESTIPPGTTSGMVKVVLEKESSLVAGEDFNVVYSFERVTPGRLLFNLGKLPRIVGGLTDSCTNRGIDFYQNICYTVHGTDCLTAELVKLLENSYRDVNIAFANEAAMICEALSVNFYEVRDYINELPNIPEAESRNPYRNIHLPGSGVGGHCLPKDTWLLFHSYNQKKPIGGPSVMLTSRRLNDEMPLHVKKLIHDALVERQLDFQEASITILGLAYKEDTDDSRNSPTLTLAKTLEESGSQVRIHDPYVKKCREFELHNSLDESVIDSDCLTLMTAHKMYDQLNLTWLRRKMRTPIIVDGRNHFNPSTTRSMGFTYRGIGHGD